MARRLPAVEALGLTTVICTDKTGTFTKNEMTVREIWVDGRHVRVSGEGYTPQGQFHPNGHVLDAAQPGGLAKNTCPFWLPCPP